MRLALCFLVLASCTSSSPSFQTTPPPTVINCPETVCPAQSCPACPAQNCPQPICPAQTCPQCPVQKCPVRRCPRRKCPVCPKLPAQPIAKKWHCFDLHRPDGQVSGYCRESKAECEHDRKKGHDLKQGKAQPCTTQEAAYCIQILNSEQMYRQLMCARTPENCEARREALQKMPALKHSSVSACKAMRNTERHKPGTFE